MGEAKVERIFRFGPFEVKTGSRELHKHGARIKLGGKPYLVLEVLLERAGQVVTRDEIRQRLWASDTFVDFEHGLNTSIKKVRQVLCDSAVKPRYIETLPRVGYRFIAQVETSSRKNGSEMLAPDSMQVGHLEAKPASSSDTSAATPPETRGEIAEFVPGSLAPWPFSLAFAMLAGAVLLASAGSTRSLRSFAEALKTSLGPAPRTYNSLAVLPLQGLSTDATRDHFSDGITDELITHFAQSGDLRVISRTSAMRYKGTNKSAQQIAKELGVDTLVEGTVERNGSRVRVRVRLVDASADRDLWAKIYDRELSDVLMLESSVAHDIVEEARGQMASRLAFRNFK